MKFEGYTTVHGRPQLKLQAKVKDFDQLITWMNSYIGGEQVAQIGANKLVAWNIKTQKSAILYFETVDKWSHTTDSGVIKQNLMPRVYASFSVQDHTHTKDKSLKTSKSTLFNPENRKQWMDDWKLAVDMDLARECANLYLLVDLEREYFNRDVENPNWRLRIALNDRIRFLDHNFTAYLDMIIGGELRHLPMKVEQYAAQAYVDTIKGVNKKKVYQQVMYALYGDTDVIEVSRYWCEECRCYHHDREGEHGHGISRQEMWSKWHGIRTQTGIDSMYAARDFFRYFADSWGSGYGGEKWAKICDCLIRHLEGRDTPLIFIDTVWSLEHNGGNCLNKVWHTPTNLQFILDSKFSGRSELVARFAEGWLKDTWVAKTGKSVNIPPTRMICKHCEI